MGFFKGWSQQSLGTYGPSSQGQLENIENINFTKYYLKFVFNGWQVYPFVLCLNIILVVYVYKLIGFTILLQIFY